MKLKNKNGLIFCDVDSVILNFDKSFRLFVNKKLNKNFTKKQFCNRKYYYLYENKEFNISYKQDRELFTEWCENNGFKNLELFKNGEYINKLYNFFKIILITHIPDKYIKDRLYNLKNYGIKYNDFIATYEKDKYINNYINKNKFENIFFIEDNYKNFGNTNLNIISPVIINAGYNIDFNCNLKFNSLKEFYDYLKDNFIIY